MNSISEVGLQFPPVSQRATQPPKHAPAKSVLDSELFSHSHCGNTHTISPGAVVFKVGAAVLLKGHQEAAGGGPINK